MKGRFDPKTVQNGVKIYKMQVPKTKYSPKTTFLDTFNFLPVALEKLPKTLELKTPAKLFFPHKWNVPKNYGKVNQGLPPKSFYYYSTFLKKKREAFDEWYQEHKNEMFDLSSKLIEYCTNDVDILYESLMKYREIFLELTKVCVTKKKPDGTPELDENGNAIKEFRGDEIFLHCSTIASTCIRMFRIKFLRDEQIPITPEGGYEKYDTQSKIGCNYLR